MKSKKLIIALAAFSLVLTLLDAGEHVLKAKSAKLHLTLIKQDEPQWEQVTDVIHREHSSIGSSVVSVIALGVLIVFAARLKFSGD